MEAWKTKSYFFGPAGHKMEVLDMTYEGMMPKNSTWHPYQCAIELWKQQESKYAGEKLKIIEKSDK